MTVKLASPTRCIRWPLEIVLVTPLLPFCNNGDAIQAAVATSKTPNVLCNQTIQIPVDGIKIRASIAINRSGKPIPKAITKSNPAPKPIDPVCAINASTPANGAVIQGLATKVDIPPKAKAPAILPPWWRPASRSIC